MVTANTTGVKIIGSVLEQIARGEPTTVAALARTLCVARSTAFDVVRRLEKAGYVSRSLEGKLVAGPAACTFGYARFAIANLHGPAEAVLRWLRDETHCRVALTCRHEGTDVAILTLEPDCLGGESSDMIEAFFSGTAPRPLGSVRAYLRNRIPRAERDFCRVCTQRAADTLNVHLLRQ